MLAVLKKELANVGGDEEPLPPTIRIKDPNAGVVSLHHNGVTIDLSFNWKVISILQRDFGKPEYLRKVATHLETRDVDGMADLISRASLSTISVEDVLAWSPPIVSTTDALNKAWLLALFGPAMQPAEAGEKPSEGKLRAFATSLKSLFKRRLGQASNGKPSGK